MSGNHGSAMIEPVTIERWQQAQVAERATHTKNMEDGIHHYRIAYSHNFRYLDIDPNERQIGVVEVGCADFPALRYCKETENCFIVEPMPSEYLKLFCNANDISLIKTPFEEIYGNYSWHRCEIWMFNVLQHVQDPEKFISVAKKAKTVRYFEPIDTGTAPYHPHSFTKDDFDRWFPGVNKYYNETTNQCFHNGPCCYGVYKNPLC